MLPSGRTRGNRAQAETRDVLSQHQELVRMTEHWHWSYRVRGYEVSLLGDV